MSRRLPPALIEIEIFVNGSRKEVALARTHVGAESQSNRLFFRWINRSPGAAVTVLIDGEFDQGTPLEEHQIDHDSSDDEGDD